VTDRNSWTVLTELTLNDAGEPAVSGVWLRVQGDLHLDAETALELADRLRSVAWSVGLPTSAGGPSGSVIRLDGRRAAAQEGRAE
jgi:hypothetical protein